MKKQKEDLTVLHWVIVIFFSLVTITMVGLYILFALGYWG